MFDFSTFLVSAAHAAEEVVPVAASASTGDELMRFLPLLLIFIVFYFLLIRPQQKKFDKQTKMLAGLKKGDKVFAGGFMGIITKFDGDDIVVVELAKDVQVKALRSSVTGLVADKKTPANNDKKK